ncbi:MAG: hypothetical protein JXX29_13420 [Deltaproteobacteria bacterium]|nr:hypothetical protein [Deltaproteobacteria bacterium]MBN2672678.1 hypothetical protein [Deltaproteobacteria bacterium]
MKYRTHALVAFPALLLLTACQSVVYLDNDTANTDTSTNSDSDTNQCAPPGTTPLVCESFEQEITAINYVRNGDIRLDSDRVFDGNASLLCETTQIESFAFISNEFAPIESGVVYFRVHLFIPPGTITGTTKVLNLTSGESPDLEEVQGIDINISSGCRVDIYQHGNQVRYQSEPDMVPEGEWFCLRGNYIISATAGETTIWINDGLAVSTTANTDSIINGGVSQFRTGIGWTEQGQTTAVFYFDNVLVDTIPVDCAAP